MPHKDLEIRKEYQRKYRERNKLILQQKAKEYSSINKDKIDSYQSEYREKNKQLKKEYDKNHYLAVREKRIKQIKDYEKKRKTTNPKFKIDKNISCYIRNSLKQNNISKNLVKWEILVGYSLEQLTEHLEKQFKPEMNWDNYGSYWHIDHIKPKSLFKYVSVDDEQFKKCWALENLQPLEAHKNLTKHNKYFP